MNCRAWRALLGGLAMVSLQSAGCGAKSDAAQKRPPPLVVVSRVPARDVPVEVRAPIDVRPLAQAEVGSKTLGYLDVVLADRGDFVKRGQLLALVRPSDLPDQLVAARGSLAQARATLSLAKKNLERMNTLAPSGVVSKQELQSSQAAVASAEAQQAGALAQVGAMATKLGETRIESPLDGVVTVRRLDPGALVGPVAGTSTIMTVARVDTLRVFIPVTEREARRVKVGQPAHVHVDALPERAIKGTVSRLAPTLDATTRTLDAEVQIDNASGELRPGMFGRGAIVVDTQLKAAIVPVSAMQISNGKYYVFVLQGDKVSRREVTIGVDEGDWFSVLKGLSEGDEIVTKGVDSISDGSAVRVARDVPPANSGESAGQPPLGKN